MGLQHSRRPYITIAVYLAITVLIGFGVFLLSLNRIECGIILSLQSFAQKTFGIQFFHVVTYLGDFYLWTVFSAVFFFYAYFMSRKNLHTSIELVTYMILIAASTYLLKEAFAQPRPNCAGITVYDQEASLSYPSGHVSRATGAFIILSKKRNTIRTILIALVIVLISLSRIVLGAHFPTDTFGAIFLSLAIHKTTEITTYSFSKSSKSLSYP